MYPRSQNKYRQYRLFLKYQMSQPHQYRLYRLSLNCRQHQQGRQQHRRQHRRRHQPQPGDHQRLQGPAAEKQDRQQPRQVGHHSHSHHRQQDQRLVHCSTANPKVAPATVAAMIWNWCQPARYSAVASSPENTAVATRTREVHWLTSRPMNIADRA